MKDAMRNRREMRSLPLPMATPRNPTEAAMESTPRNTMASLLYFLWGLFFILLNPKNRKRAATSAKKTDFMAAGALNNRANSSIRYLSLMTADIEITRLITARRKAYPAIFFQSRGITWIDEDSSVASSAERVPSFSQSERAFRTILAFFLVSCKGIPSFSNLT
jgi:hypothetical protein